MYRRNIKKYPGNIMYPGHHSKDNEMIDYKFNEDKILEELKQYIDSTYSQHYATEDNLQAIDVFTALGSVITTSRDNAIKYLMRFGKKEGMNRKDIIKVIHYMFFILNEMDNDKNTNNRG